MDEAAYREGLKSALQILRPLAQAGQREACLIVDHTTGAHLNFQIGEQNEVTPDWSKISTEMRVTVLHTHPLNIAFGPEDWDVLANHATVTEIRAVCPDEIFILAKPDNWPFQAACRPGLSVLGSVFERLLAAVRAEPAFARAAFESESVLRPLKSTKLTNA